MWKEAGAKAKTGKNWVCQVKISELTQQVKKNNKLFRSVKVCRLSPSLIYYKLNQY